MEVGRLVLVGRFGLPALFFVELRGFATLPDL
jgi:hypothetical protein